MGCLGVYDLYVGGAVAKGAEVAEPLPPLPALKQLPRERKRRLVRSAQILANWHLETIRPCLVLFERLLLVDHCQ
jgi:hypothetical protein